MFLDRVNSQNSYSDTVGYKGGASNTTQTDSSQQSTTGNQNDFANYVVTYAYKDEGGNTPVLTAGPDHTFGQNNKPAYNSDIDQLGTSPGSDNGQVAANSVLRLEQSGDIGGVSGEAQFVTQALASHKNDPLFLQQYLGTLGSDRTAQIFRYLTSLGHVQTPDAYGPGTVDANQAKQQYQDMADALSTLVKNKDFNQKDMDQLVGQFAKDSPENNFTFAKDVLGKASPDVNQMFYQSAKSYALQNTGSSSGQAMAAYAMQALSQTLNPMPQLANMPQDQLSSLVKAAMQGEAHYGNPPSMDDFAKTGVYRAEDGKGAPLDGLSHLMFNAAYSDVGDQFARAPLSPDQAHDLQSRLFQASVGALQSDSSLQSFYNGSVPMKDAMAADFQEGYDSIVKAYSGPDGELTSNGMGAFQEFFKDALFTPPPSSNAQQTASFFQDKLSSFMADANRLPADGSASLAQRQLATSMGEQAQAMAAALKQSFASILAGSTKANQDTQNVINTLLTAGEAAGGSFGLAPAVGSAIIGESLKLLVASGSDHSVSDAVNDLKSHGIDVTKYTNGTLQDQSEGIQNYQVRTAYQNGLNNTNRVLG